MTRLSIDVTDTERLEILAAVRKYTGSREITSGFGPWLAAVCREWLEHRATEDEKQAIERERHGA